MAKKRTQATAGIEAAGEGRSTKKRKAAEASEAKTRRMTDAAADSELESDEEMVRSSRSKRKKDGKPNAQRIEDMPLFAPGFRLFEGFSDTIRNTEIAALTKVDPDMEQSRKYGFTLKPLIVTEGPLAGETILVLQKTATFRFLDLPPEIRNMVYGHLIEAPESTTISSYKPIGKERRSVSSTFRPGNYTTRRGQTWDKENGRWLGRPTSPHNLLRVCKQVQSETGTLLYGDTKFCFQNWSDANLFLDTIGSMRRFLQQAHLPDGFKGYSKANSVIRKIKDATNLQSLTVDHGDTCSKTRYRGRGWLGVSGFVNTVKPVLIALQKRGAHSENLLDMVGVDAGRRMTYMCCHCKGDKHSCYLCRHGRDHEQTCLKNGGCGMECKDLKSHCEELQAEVRSALAKALGIEEEA